MTRRRTLFGGHDNHSGGHGDRPWVYFMIDSFFLITQFFVLTFHIGHDLVLPHTLHNAPPGTTFSVNTGVTILVNRDPADIAPTYKINGGESMDRSTVESKLSAMVVGKNPSDFSVKISAQGNTTFGDVMPLLSICKKLKFPECGIQPSRRK